MAEAISWWLALEGIGLLGLPLAVLVCRNLPDRGWTLTKPLSLLLVGWLVWFPLTLFSGLPYSRLWIVGTLLVFAAGNVWLLRRAGVRQALGTLPRQARGYLVLSEGVFALAFALMAWVRSFTPGVVDTEKFMDEAFVSAILRAPHLPPPDPWLAGYSINYYYFGHFLVATVAKLLGTSPAVAFNVGIAAIFALAAVAVFGVAANLWATFRGLATRALSRASGAGILSALAVLVFGNFTAVQVWWQTATALTKGPHAALGNPLAWWFHPQLWAQQDWWATWWSPSRAIPNTITEFPAFSFLLADLHAHVLALPFVVLAVGLALNLILARGAGLAVYASDSGRLGEGVLALLATGIALGSLYAINGWDLPTYLGLAVLALLVQQWLAHDREVSTFFLLDLATAVAMLAVVAVAAFVPFYRGFSSPAQGVGILATSARTPIGDFFAMFGLATFLVVSLLTWRLAGAVRRAAGTLGATLFGAAVAVLLLLTLLTPAFTGWVTFWGLLVVLACAGIALHILGVRVAEGRLVVADLPVAMVASDRCRARVWLFVLIGTAAALVVACEVIYLRDVFSGSPLLRMNTVFKLYYQAWLILGVAIGPMVCWLLGGVRAAWGELGVVLARSQVAMSGKAGSGSLQPNPLSPFPKRKGEPERAMAHGDLGEAFGGAQPSVALAAGEAPGDGDVARGDDGATASNLTPYPRCAVRMLRVALAPLLAPDGARACSPSLKGRGKRTAYAVRGFLSRHRDSTQAAHSQAGTHSPGWAVALRALGAGGIVIWTCALGLALLGALVYPVLATVSRTDGFTLPRSLDGTAYMATDPTNLGDGPAIAWLNAHVSGEAVIVEAAKYDEYTHYARVSTFTGLPTLIGWGGHEVQWRLAWLSTPANAGIIQQRLGDVQTIYTSGDEARVLSLLRQYHVSYVYVGAAERQLYGGTGLAALKSFLRVVYARDGVTIYATPWA